MAHFTDLADDLLYFCSQDDAEAALNGPGWFGGMDTSAMDRAEQDIHRCGSQLIYRCGSLLIYGCVSPSTVAVVLPDTRWPCQT
jgi:hypothetical protein